MKKPKLTDFEEKLLAYIYGFQSDNTHLPTAVQIAEDIGCSRQAVDEYLRRLIDKGYLKSVPLVYYSLAKSKGYVKLKE